MWEQRDDRVLYSFENHLCLKSGNSTLAYLGEAEGIRSASLSPDGTMVVYVREMHPDDVRGFSIHRVRPDGQDDEILLTGDQLNLTLPDGVTTPLPITLSSIRWIPGSHQLVFLTHFNIYDYTNALHSLDADTGSHRVRLDTGSAGWFRISPNGRTIAVIHPERIGLMDSNGENWQPAVLTYPRLICYCDSRYPIPGVRWASDSSGLYVAVPAPDPRGNDTTAHNWFVPADGTPPYKRASLGDLRLSIAQSINWSPDGEYLVAETVDKDGQAGLDIMRFDGSDRLRIFEGHTTFRGWDAESQSFLFQDGDITGDWYRASLDGTYTPYTLPQAPDQDCSPG